jgi:hypothetical protein
MPRGIFITGKDIMQLEAVASSSAFRLMQTIRDALGKQKGTKITLNEYAKYRGVELAEIKQALQQ